MPVSKPSLKQLVNGKLPRIVLDSDPKPPRVYHPGWPTSVMHRMSLTIKLINVQDAHKSSNTARFWDDLVPPCRRGGGDSWGGLTQLGITQKLDHGSMMRWPLGQTHGKFASDPVPVFSKKICRPRDRNDEGDDCRDQHRRERAIK